MKKLLVLLTLCVLGAAAFAAGPEAKLKFALIVESTVDDHGWAQTMHEAILRVQKKLGADKLEYSYSEKMKPVDAGSAARQYAAKGYDVVIAHGAQFKNLVLEMADEFPKVTFAFGTSAENGPKNVFTYMPQAQEIGYLNGIIAGKITKSNIIGVVGPVDGGDAASYNRGFILGVKASNPKATVNVAYTGSFGDYVKAAELAQTHIKSGADVLTGSAQQSLGALRAVAEYKDKPIYWLGQDTALLSVPEGFKVVAAGGYDYAAVINELLEARKKGAEGGVSIPLNFKNGGLTYQFSAKSPVLNAEIKAAVEKAKADITSGKLAIDWKSVK